MSSPSTPSASEANAGSGVMTAVNALISAREGEPVPTVIQNIVGVVKTTGRAIRTLLGTTADAAFGVTEAVLALPTNAIGLVSQGLNAAVVRPVHNTRAAMRDVLFGQAA